MSQREFEHQMTLIDTHISKALQCLEYGKLDDFDVHIKIAEILKDGLQAKWDYEKESLSNLAQALTN